MTACKFNKVHLEFVEVEVTPQQVNNMPENGTYSVVSLIHGL